MTPCVSRTRPHIAVRAVRGLVAVLLTAGWLALPGVPSARADGPAAVPGGMCAAGSGVTPAALSTQALSTHDGSFYSSDYVLPVAVLVGAAAAAAYAYAHRSRRALTRTTPASALGAGADGEGTGAGAGTGTGATESRNGVGVDASSLLDALDTDSKVALVAVDDAIRTSEEELGFATDQLGDEAVRPFAEAVARAKAELSAAFRLRQQLDELGDDDPADDEVRQGLLDEVVSRCADADERLDAEAAAFDRLRDLEHHAPQALTAAESAFRTLTGRTAAADSVLVALRQQYEASATAPVTSHVEGAKERLVFATTTLNLARQALDADDNDTAAVYVRAAEGAVAQTAMLVEAVERRARELADAGVDAEAGADVEGAVADADSAVALADVYISTHRGAVGCEARTRLSEARRHLQQAGGAAESGPAGALARQAQSLAESDVHSFEETGNTGESAVVSRGEGGLSGAVLGGIILGAASETGETGGTGGPGSFGGGGTRRRKGGGGRF
ncbi:hypothetical protein AB0G73_10955 [Streptomyces sp. NPDC020719]|uniref:hypothetical protein n=1 Tax=Streptomyces sp. NPDC020719 TaxID=3154896 RepID=UPI0033E3C8EF